MSTTITEALAELKTLEKKVTKKREFVSAYLYRQEALKDPFAKDGGSFQTITEARQAIGDLEKRHVAIRLAIQKSNEATVLAVNGTSQSISEWLTWRREVAPGTQAFLKKLFSAIADVRRQAREKGMDVIHEEQARQPSDIIINIDEKELVEEQETLEEILGTLDGLLSLNNATNHIEL